MALKKRIECIIIDDEQLARTLISDYVKRLDYLNLAGSFKSPLDAIVFLKSNRVDLIFLDIQMLELSGLELLRTFKQMPYVIIVSAYQEYAIDGFELEVTDYLLKPVPFERFMKGVNKVAFEISKQQEQLKSSDTIDKVLVLKSNNKLHRIKHSDIMFIEGMKEYLRFHTKDSKFMVLKSFKDLENELDDEFIRIHKSYIVNINFVGALNGNQLEIKNTCIPIGSTYKKDVLAKVFLQD